MSSPGRTNRGGAGSGAGLVPRTSQVRCGWWVMASEANDQRRLPRRATRRDERGGSLIGPREADLRGRPEAPRTRPANENDAGASMATAALRRRPSASAFWAAFAVSLLWIVLCTVVMFIPISAGLPSPLQGTGMARLA